MSTTELTQKIQQVITDALADAIAKIAVEAIAVGTEIALTYLHQAQPPKPSNNEDLILTLLQTPQHIDDLHVQSHIPIPTLHAVLLQMEFAGKIQQRPGKIFTRA